MTGPRHLRAADYRAMRWANGGGVTTELAREPAEGERYRWRISIATVDGAGPFSAFPGYDRIITLLAGDGIALSFGSAHASATIDRPLEPFPFSGDWKTDCRLLGGTVTDFNVISDRSQGRSDVTLVPPSSMLQSCLMPGAVQLIYAVESRVDCRIEKNREIVLEIGESLLRHRGDGDLGLLVRPGGGALVVDLDLPL